MRDFNFNNPMKRPARKKKLPKMKKGYVRQPPRLVVGLKGGIPFILQRWHLPPEMQVIVWDHDLEESHSHNEINKLPRSQHGPYIVYDMEDGRS